MRHYSKLIGKLAVTATVLFGLCALGPAPIQGQKLGIKPHTNLQPQDERTLESEQTPVVMAPVGSAPDEHRDQEVQVQAGSHDAVSVLSAAQRGGRSGADDSARSVLNAASARMGGESSHSWLWALLVLGCVVGGVFGVKRWADNNIPNAPTVVPKRQGW
ncbi:MAG: hypothetical protein ACYC96_07400 [Fimbriimonadaceae bacterium]